MARGQPPLYLGAAPGRGQDVRHAQRGPAARRTVAPTSWSATSRPTAGRAPPSSWRPRGRPPPRSSTAAGVRGDGRRRHPRPAPDVALVDELAHTNVPGSRHEKRWQDVEELLDAGIDVISTVNIQHLESLNDVVEEHHRHRAAGDECPTRSCGRRPGRAGRHDPRGAAPAHGPRQHLHAREGRRRPVELLPVGNLGALRELALLWVADRSTRRSRSTASVHGISGTWETRERVVVALTGAPGGEDLIRRAARMASGARRAHGRARRGRPTDSPAPSASGSRASQLLEELGGRYVEVVGDDVAKALVGGAGRERHAAHPRRQPPLPLGRAPSRLGDQRVVRTAGSRDRRPRHLDHRDTPTGADRW